jgi:hypothetical protein
LEFLKYLVSVFVITRQRFGILVGDKPAKAQVWGSENAWSGEKTPGEKTSGLGRKRLVWGENAWSGEKTPGLGRKSLVWGEKAWSVEKKPDLVRKILKNLGLGRKSLALLEKS